MDERESKNNKMGGWIGSVAIHGLLVLIFLSLAALRPGDKYEDGAEGVPSALGFDDEGQTSEELPQEIAEITPPVEEVVTPVEEPVEEETPTEEVKDDEVADVVKPIDKPKPQEKKKEQTKPVEDKPKTENQFKRNSQGDKNKDGQQGSKDGNPDVKNVFNRNSGNGQKGNGSNDIGNGANLDIKGWKWDRLPTEQDPTSENGWVKFKFSVDEDGNILNITKLDGANLTVAEVNFYRKQLEKVKFTWKDDNIDPPANTTGYYTFKILSR
jgi:protein TonB